MANAIYMNNCSVVSTRLRRLRNNSSLSLIARVVHFIGLPHVYVLWGIRGMKNVLELLLSLFIFYLFTMVLQQANDLEN
jgi:hypothetical protein